MEKIFYFSYFCSKHRLLIFAQNISMFWSNNKKNRSIPAYPFFYIEVGFMGVNIARACFPDENSRASTAYQSFRNCLFQKHTFLKYE